MASSSSATPGEHHHHPAGGVGIPAPPPPTPSNHSLSPTPTAADMALSRFLCQLSSPGLSLPALPSRFSSAGPPKLRRAPTPPVISLVQPQEALLRSAAAEFGFFHLTDHGVPSDLPAEAHRECRSLLCTRRRDLSALGFEFDEAGGDDDEGEGSSFLVFDVGAAADPGLPRAVREYARHMEKVGMEVVEMLSRAGGFRSPFGEMACKPRSLVWISPAAKGGDEDADGGDRDRDEANGTPPLGRCYPYVVCLQHEMRSWSRCLLLGDDPGWVTLAPHADSVLVAIGDIAQVWSDGGFKKVKGRPVPAAHGSDESCVTISALITLSTDTAIAPLPPAGQDGASDDEGCGGSGKFSAFPFEEYAWRVFHEQFPLGDPLRRYLL